MEKQLRDRNVDIVFGDFIDQDPPTGLASVTTRNGKRFDNALLVRRETERCARSNDFPLAGTYAGWATQHCIPCVVDGQPSPERTRSSEGPADFAVDRVR
jgi:hypothetical protein